MKPNLLDLQGRCRSDRTDDHHLIVLDDGYHPGNRRSLSLNGELLGTLGELPANQVTGTAWRPQGREEVEDTIVAWARESREHGEGCQPIRWNDRQGPV